MSRAEVAARPSVSVIIPTYDRAGYVGEAVDSVLRQEGVGGCEVIVVDDGSTDGTCEALAPWRARIRYVRQENAGQAAARNHGLRLARGDLVWFLDSDDVLLPRALADMLACIEAHPDLDAVQGGWRVADAGGRTLADVEPWQRSPRLDLDTWVMDTPVFLGGLACRRARALGIGGFDETLPQVEDVDFALRLALSGCRFAWLRRPVVLYRQHAGNITHDAREEADAMLRVFEALFERPELPERIRLRRDEVFYYRHLWSAWRLCRRGLGHEAAPHLRRARTCTKLAPEQAALQWARHFADWSRGAGGRDEALAALLSQLPAILDLHGAPWREIESVLPWWAAVWSHYVRGDAPPSRDAWSAWERLPRNALLALAQQSLVLTPVDAMNGAIERFLADARGRALASDLGSADAVSLHLTAFGQAGLARRPRPAARALARALRHSARPGALPAWGRFLSSALAYARSDAKASPGSWR